MEDNKLFLIKNNDADCMKNYKYFIVKSDTKNNATKNVVDFMNNMYKRDNYKYSEFTCIEINNNLFLNSSSIFVIE